MATKIIVLISGSGTNLQALIDATATSALPHTSIVRVVSDRKAAYGLKRAEAACIPTAHHGILPYKHKYSNEAEAREAYDNDLAKLVLADSPHLVVCAGFMRIVTSAFLNPMHEARVPIINLHPSLYGDLVGANCIEKAWQEYQEGKRRVTGAMIHYVVADVDRGEMIVQQDVQISGCDRLEQLQEKLHEVEHVLIVQGTRKVIANIGSGG